MWISAEAASMRKKNAAVAVSWPKQIPLQRFERMVVFHRAHVAQHVQLHRAVSSSQQLPAMSLSQGRTVLEHTQPDQGAAQHGGFMKGRHFQRRKRFAGEMGGENGIVAPSLQVLEEERRAENWSVNLEQS